MHPELRSAGKSVQVERTGESVLVEDGFAVFLGVIKGRADDGEAWDGSRGGCICDFSG